MSFANLIAKAVTKTTLEWAQIKKREERDKQSAARMKQRYSRGFSTRTTIKDAAYRAIPGAYAKAAGGSGLAAARQVMYAARGDIQRWTGETLDDAYFTQTLLPAYIRENPQRTANWDVVYDARGHFREPHTEHEINLGTIGVRNYLASMRAKPDLEISLPKLGSRFPTIGYPNRFGAVVYIEKEGFLPLLEKAKFAERYDLAIMSSKGMGSTAARDLIGSLCHSVKILVVHDFDKSGFSIVGTLTRNTERYRGAVGVKVIDVGLRLADVEKWNLESEDVSHKGNPAANLRENGASAPEIAFLRNQRVELNAFTSDNFVAWLESKLKEHGVEKIVPDKETLEAAYKRAAGLNRYNAILAAAKDQVEAFTKSLCIPADFAERIRTELDGDPELAWDDAIKSLAPRWGDDPDLHPPVAYPTKGRA